VRGVFPRHSVPGHPLASGGPMRAMYPYRDRERGPVISRTHHIRVKCELIFHHFACFLNYPSSDGVLLCLRSFALCTWRECRVRKFLTCSTTCIQICILIITRVVTYFASEITMIAGVRGNIFNVHFQISSPCRVHFEILTQKMRGLHSRQVQRVKLRSAVLGGVEIGIGA